MTSVRVSSMRPNRRCEDRLLAAGEDEGMPAYGVDLTECAQDRRNDVDWSTSVTWNGTEATFVSERGAPPTWILGTHDLAALGRLAGRQPAPP